MKAIEYTRYGAPIVLQFKEVNKPSPKANELLIKVFASTVTSADIMMRKGKPYIGRLYLGVKGPKRTIPGFEFAGEVVEMGTGVTSFNIGDRVFGGTTTLGCYAQYVCVNANDVVTTMPENMTYAEAAPVSGSAITVLHFLKGKANIKKGDKVLINGASGALGTYAVQYAKHAGAQVTGVCSAINFDMVRSLGADFVIDYTRDDFTKNGVEYDIIFDTVGKRSYAQCKNSLTEEGICPSAVADFRLLLNMLSTSIMGGKKAKTSATGMLPVKTRLNYLIEIKELMQMGKIRTVIDHHSPLSEMETAHMYVEAGHKKGNIIITV